MAEPGGDIPLFPLHTVLFPHGRLPLNIFEARYLDLVSRSLRDASPFVVVLIRDGHEVVRERHETPPSLCEIGTLATITDFDSSSGGRLRVTIEGQHRVRLEAARQVENHLLLGQVTPLEDLTAPLGPDHEELIDILSTLTLHPLIQRLGVVPEELDCHRLSCLLGQYLPLDERLKQTLLSTDDPVQRLDAVAGLVQQIQGQEETNSP